MAGQFLTELEITVAVKKMNDYMVLVLDSRLPSVNALGINAWKDPPPPVVLQSMKIIMCRWAFLDSTVKETITCNLKVNLKSVGFVSWQTSCHLEKADLRSNQGIRDNLAQAS